MDHTRKQLADRPHDITTRWNLDDMFEATLLYPREPDWDAVACSMRLINLGLGDGAIIIPLESTLSCDGSAWVRCVLRAGTGRRARLAGLPDPDVPTFADSDSPTHGQTGQGHPRHPHGPLATDRPEDTLTRLERELEARLGCIAVVRRLSASVRNPSDLTLLESFCRQAIGLAEQACRKAVSPRPAARDLMPRKILHADGPYHVSGSAPNQAGAPTARGRSAFGTQPSEQVPRTSVPDLEARLPTIQEDEPIPQERGQGVHDSRIALESSRPVHPHGPSHDTEGPHPSRRHSGKRGEWWTRIAPGVARASKADFPGEHWQGKPQHLEVAQPEHLASVQPPAHLEA